MTRQFSSLECVTHTDYFIEERKYGIFWRKVMDPSQEVMLDMSGNTQKYPYRFDTKQEAKDFIINELIGKDNYRDELITEILK